MGNKQNVLYKLSQKPSFVPFLHVSFLQNHLIPCRSAMRTYDYNYKHGSKHALHSCRVRLELEAITGGLK